jgi:hypothetical protein
MLNLTETAITLIDESGETTAIDPSKYVARVETTRQQVDGIYAPNFDSDDMPGPQPCVPIIEEVPTKITIEPLTEIVEAFGLLDFVDNLREGSVLLIVAREVAEAAYALKHICSANCPNSKMIPSPNPTCSVFACKQHGKPHPLADRMVFLDDPKTEFSGNGDAIFQTITAKSLRRIPQESAR